MFKSALFLSLYIFAGIASWGAYTFIAEKDSSISSLSKLATEIAPELSLRPEKKTANIISRWKDYQGNWNYEKAPYSELTFKDYAAELKSLPPKKAETASTTEIHTSTITESHSLFAEVGKLFDRKDSKK